MTSGDVVVITGAASGIGRAVAELVSGAGAAVGLLDASEDALKETEASLSAGDARCCFVVCDVTNRENLDSAVARVEADFGPITGLVTCAGIHEVASISELATSAVRRMFEVNAIGTIHATQAVLPSMLKNKGGAIATVSSLSGVRGHPAVDGSGGSHYAASKGAVIAFTKSAALELAHERIRVNCVAPAMVDTPLVRRSYTDDQIENYKRTVPLGRIGRPEDVAAAIVFLLSDDARFITGQVLNVCGGTSLV